MAQYIVSLCESFSVLFFIGLWQCMNTGLGCACVCVVQFHHSRTHTPVLSIAGKTARPSPCNCVAFCPSFLLLLLTVCHFFCWVCLDRHLQRHLRSLFFLPYG